MNVFAQNGQTFGTDHSVQNLLKKDLSSCAFLM